MAEERDAREVGERIARLLEELRAQANPYAWQQVDELLGRSSISTAADWRG